MAVFFLEITRDKNANRPPKFDDISRRATKEDTRDENIRVNDNQKIKKLQASD